jgi:membrane protein YdbS with pleckstrin-like domain
VSLRVFTLYGAAILLLLIMIPAVTYIRMRRTHYTFEDGWLIIASGILFVREKAYELTHLIDLEITRGPIDLVTGNCKLHLNFDKFGKVTLYGLGKIGIVKELRTSLMNLARLLRSHPLIKGIILT